ncbi:MAG TPA: GNAT family N-acetyltransferase [Gemmatimonadaceae bacterium]|nr:GNAT family N-acetyltransferase [Gemmatimonadaceae bacterium]
MTEHVIRPAHAGDADTFVAHRIALYREAGDIPPGDAAASLAFAISKAFVDGIANGSCLAWIATSGQADLAGSAAMQIVPRLPSPQNRSSLEGYVAQLFILPDWRRRGIGSALMKAVVAAARHRYLGRIRLHSTKEGLAMYERLGFKIRTNDMELFI